MQKTPARKLTVRRSRKIAREPLPELFPCPGETTTGNFSERLGAEYYSAAQLDACWNSFEQKPGADRADFDKRMRGAAWSFVETARSKFHRPPSVRLRELDRLAEKVRRGRVKSDDISRETHWHLFEELHAAALDISQADDGLPDAELTPYVVTTPDGAGGVPELRERVMRIWPVDLQLECAVERGHLEWLLRVIERAKERVQWDREPKYRPPPKGARRFGFELQPKGGNRADDHLNDFVKAVLLIYSRHAARPARPWTDSISGARCGEALSLLTLALRPLLRVGASGSDVHAIYRRILAAWPA